MKERRLYGILLVLAVVLAGVSGYLVYTHIFPSQAPVKFKPYTSVFHLLFKEEPNNLLGNLTGKLSISEPSKGTIRSICKLSFSSAEQGGSSIEKIELFTSWICLIYEGPHPILIPAPPLRKVTLHAGEEIILFECSHDISDFKEEPMIVLGFSQGTRIGHPEWGNLTLPTIRVHFSDGGTWRWEYEYGITPPFPLWSGIRDWKLSELSGKSETATITLTIKKAKPPLIEIYTLVAQDYFKEKPRPVVFINPVLRCIENREKYKPIPKELVQVLNNIPIKIVFATEEEVIDPKTERVKNDGVFITFSTIEFIHDRAARVEISCYWARFAQSGLKYFLSKSDSQWIIEKVEGWIT